MSSAVSIGARFVARSLALVALATALSFTIVVATPPPAAHAASTTEAATIVTDLKAQYGKPWVRSATGMRSFDCSGLVFRMYEMNGLLDRIGGRRRTVTGFYNWFRERGRVSRTNPKIGDLVVWGANKHIGVYVGDGYAISTLTSGVKRHRVNGLYDRFKAYLHVSLDR